MFDPNSRYFALPNKTLELPDGKKLVYKGRRLLPPLNQLEKIAEITLQAGERLDIVATRLLGDPLRFWQLCDSNDTLNPADLEQPGQAITVANSLIEAEPEQ